MWPKLAICSGCRANTSQIGQKGIRYAKCLFLYMMNSFIERLWNSGFD